MDLMSSKSTVVKLSIVNPQGEELAYMYQDEGFWRDPFGGDFSDDEVRQFQYAATGGGSGRVTMGAGTKHERRIDVRLTATFI
jgi:hypothetical protein